MYILNDGVINQHQIRTSANTGSVTALRVASLSLEVFVSESKSTCISMARNDSMSLNSQFLHWQALKHESQHVCTGESVEIWVSNSSSV